LTQTNAATSEVVSATRTAVTVTVRQLPLAATLESPADGAINQTVQPTLYWAAAASGNAPTQYKVYLGTANPPTTLVSTIDVPSTSYDTSVLEYNTQYFWQVIPTNLAGDATDCPIWSFSTTDLYVQDLPPVDTGTGSINPQIAIPDVSGSFTPVIVATWAPPEITIPNVGLALNLSGGIFTGRVIRINPGLGFIPLNILYKVEPAITWTNIQNPGDWTLTDVYFTIPGAGKADGDVEVLFPDTGEGTLAVELSSFTAIVTSNSSMVRLNWTVQSETNHLGYNILRSETTSLSDACQINNGYITNGTNQGTAVDYTYYDQEVQTSGIYFYWLESIELNSAVQYHGPVMVNMSIPSEEPTPDIPLYTKLCAAYPNPFNPSTRISYYLKSPAQVSLQIFNLRGECVRSFHESYAAAGTFSQTWDGRDEQGRKVSSGCYYYRMTSGKYTATKKMILLK
jgi:hypothetical protein